LKPCCRSISRSLASRATEYRFAVRSGLNTFYIGASAVDWIESADNYARLWTGGRSHLVREPLQRLADVLQSEGFIRVHRTALVNIRRVRELRRMRELRRTRPNQPTVVLHDGTRIVVSRERRAVVEETLRSKPTS
jgi:two-component system, LytTR family, response regulator